jgi:simple sugar transport system permease protein
MNEAALVLALAAAIAAGTPLVLAGLGELLTERSGVINVGVEGMMLMGAVSAFLVADYTSSITLGLLAGAATAGLLALVHAFLCVSMRANQIVSGLALVIFGAGVAMFIGRPIEGKPLAVRIVKSPVPYLSDIPYIGDVLFRQDMVVYLSWFLVVAAAIYLTHTKFGLAVRAVGENPAAADVTGIRVATVQYIHTVLGGLLVGSSGAYLMLARAPNWSQAGTTSGLGWIAVALVVFSSWRPARLLLGAYVFGLTLRLNFNLQAAGIHDIPAEFLAMVPYLLTIGLMIILSTRSTRLRGAPAALGMPYIRTER